MFDQLPLFATPELVSRLLENFPHEAVPDGVIAAPHHYTYLLLAAILASLTVWDDYRDKEPIVVVGLLVASLVTFNLMWPHAHYRPLAPLASLVLPLVAVLAIVLPVGHWRFWPWERQRPYPIGTSWAVVLLTLGGLDDAVEHAFGVWTPLDWFFGAYGVMASAIVGIVAVSLLTIAVWQWDRVYKTLNLGPP